MWITLGYWLMRKLWCSSRLRRHLFSNWELTMKNVWGNCSSGCMASECLIQFFTIIGSTGWNHLYNVYVPWCHGIYIITNGWWTYLHARSSWLTLLVSRNNRWGGLKLIGWTERSRGKWSLAGIESGYTITGNLLKSCDELSDVWILSNDR